MYPPFHVPPLAYVCYLFCLPDFWVTSAPTTIAKQSLHALLAAQSCLVIFALKLLLCWSPSSVLQAHTCADAAGALCPQEIPFLCIC